MKTDKEFKYCEYFDGGTCDNPKEFGIGSTEITGHYCENECRYNLKKKYYQLLQDLLDERERRLVSEEREREAVGKLKESWVASGYIKRCDIQTCPYCGGDKKQWEWEEPKGMVLGDDCQTCKGRGWVDKN